MKLRLKLRLRLRLAVPAYLVSRLSRIRYRALLVALRWLLRLAEPVLGIAVESDTRRPALLIGGHHLLLAVLVAIVTGTRWPALLAVLQWVVGLAQSALLVLLWPGI